MTFTATVLSGAVAAAQPFTGVADFPEPVSMALLSVVLAGVSMVVPRAGAKTGDRDRRESGTAPRP